MGHEHEHHHGHHEDCDDRDEKLERKELLRIAKALEELVRVTKDIRTELGPKYPVRALITQGDTMSVTGTIKGLAPGGSDTFFATPVDHNGNPATLPAGSPTPAFSSDDPTVSLVDAPDGMSTQATAATSATTAFNLTWTATFTKADGTSATISGTANVPILPPVANEPTSAVLSQGSPAA